MSQLSGLLWLSSVALYTEQMLQRWLSPSRVAVGEGGGLVSPQRYCVKLAYGMTRWAAVCRVTRRHIEPGRTGSEARKCEAVKGEF